MKKLPASSIISVPMAIASNLLRAAESLPKYANREFYKPELQLHVYREIRNACQDDFDELLLSMKTRIQDPPYSLLIRGLTFDSNYRLFVALNRAFGLMVARPYEENTPRAQLIHHIEPHTDKNTGGGVNSLHKLTEKLHTDCADRPVPVRFVSMQCVHPDATGQGRSRVLDSIGFRAKMQEAPLDRDMISALEGQAVPWQIIDFLGGGVSWAPILKGDCIRWRRYTIDAALKGRNIELPEYMIKILDHVDALLIQNDHHVFDFLLASGDFLIMDNHRCLHSRSAINNSNTQRLMLRAWVE